MTGSVPSPRGELGVLQAQDLAAPDLASLPDLAPCCTDVGVLPGHVYACQGVFGGSAPSAAQLCMQLGAAFQPVTSSTSIDPQKLGSLPGFYLAAVYGVLNIANQQVSCTSGGFGEPAIFGGGMGDRGVKNAQPAPCAGFAKFYDCADGSIDCGSANTLETTVNPVSTDGVLCGN